MYHLYTYDSTAAIQSEVYKVYTLIGKFALFSITRAPPPGRWMVQATWRGEEASLILVSHTIGYVGQRKCIRCGADQPGPSAASSALRAMLQMALAAVSSIRD